MLDTLLLAREAIAWGDTGEVLTANNLLKARRMVEAFDSHAAPWYVIPADHRWLRDLLVASLLAKAFEQLALDWPRRPAPFGHHDLDAIP